MDTLNYFKCLDSPLLGFMKEFEQNEEEYHRERFDNYAN